MAKIRISRSITIPEPLKISRYQKNPELGPRILFFSGGSALNGLCRVLKNFTHNSIHLVTPYDSGGSSAKLRQAFNMPAIGDLRSRLIALADETVLGHPEIYQLFTYRLPEEEDQFSLHQQVESMAAGKHQLVAQISNPMRKLICHQLGFFLQSMPTEFNLKGASIGNLILAGGYLNNHQQLEPIIFLFSKLVNVQGTVTPTANDNYHLSAELTDGRRITGQHRITGKEQQPLDTPIKSLSLSSSLEKYQPAQSQLQERNLGLVEKAELICYPMGSLYSSLIANLLPSGVGKAISENDCPKVYIPNLGYDPEQVDMSLQASVEALITHLQQDHAGQAELSKLLNCIIVDSKNGNYRGGVPFEFLKELGIQVIDLALIDNEQPNQYDNQKLVSALLSLT